MSLSFCAIYCTLSAFIQLHNSDSRLNGISKSRNNVLSDCLNNIQYRFSEFLDDVANSVNRIRSLLQTGFCMEATSR